MALSAPRTGAAGDGEEPDDPGRMTLVEHLAELRNRLIKALLAVVIGGAVGFALYDPVLDQLVDPYCQILKEQAPDRACRLVITDPLESFSIRLKLSAYLGLLFASPVVLWQLWRFITPGLYSKEKRYAVPFVLSSVLLFALGAFLALVTFPRTLDFLSAFAGENTEAFYTPGKYLGLLTFMMLAFGVGFEFPVVLVALQAAGILHWRRLASWRRYAIVVIFVVDAVITPSGDPVTLCALAVPMYLFYEVAILIGRFVLRR
ncbi:MAG: twin-arginine translocase subunit TatC [Actinomycetota bacterium]|nr:twin-arginine translocase subunit TatC [Actinomycetota bacterium]